MYKIVAVISLFALSGCASMTANWAPYPAYSPSAATENVEILNFAPASRKYKTIGSIHAEAMSQKAALDKAVRTAGLKGADAIVITKSEPSFLILMPWHVLDAAAIKYQGE
jgi:hypothetical protein